MRRLARRRYSTETIRAHRSTGSSRRSSVGRQGPGHDFTSIPIGQVSLLAELWKLSKWIGKSGEALCAPTMQLMRRKRPPRYCSSSPVALTQYLNLLEAGPSFPSMFKTVVSPGFRLIRSLCLVDKEFG